MLPEKERPGGGTGHCKILHLQNTTLWCIRQLVKFALPWIAAIITTTKFTARKSLFLDRLTIMAEGGEDAS